MHQRAGRDARGAPVSRDGGRGLGAGTNRRGREGRRQERRSRGSGPRKAGLPLPPLVGLACLLSTPATAGATGRERGPEGRGLFLCPLPRAPPEDPPSLVFHWLGEIPFFSFSVIDWVRLFRAPPIGGRAGVLSCYDFFSVKGGGRIYPHPQPRKGRLEQGPAPRPDWWAGCSPPPHSGVARLEGKFASVPRPL